MSTFRTENLTEARKPNKKRQVPCEEQKQQKDSMHAEHTFKLKKKERKKEKKKERNKRSTDILFCELSRVLKNIENAGK